LPGLQNGTIASCENLVTALQWTGQNLGDGDCRDGEAQVARSLGAEQW